jgi:hypothetical protein
MKSKQRQPSVIERVVAMDMAAQEGGGVVYAPRGDYFFAGHLDVSNSGDDSGGG